MFLRYLFTERERKELDEFVCRLINAIEERKLSDIKTIYDEAKRHFGYDLAITSQQIRQYCWSLNWLDADEAIDVLKFLIRHGDDVRATDETGRTLLILTMGCDLEMTRNLLDRGSDPNARDDEWRTPLYYAIKIMSCTKEDELVHLLLEAGADVNQPCSKTSDTLLMMCIHSFRYFEYELCKFLLQSGANVNATDNFNRTALHYVQRSPRVVQLLCQYGADAEIKDNDGLDAVQSAAYYHSTYVGFKHEYSYLINVFEVLEFLLNLESYPPEKKGDAYNFLGCMHLIHCCCIIAHSFEKYDPNDYQRKFHEVLFSMEDYPIGYFHAYQKFVQGIQMWKKAVEIRSELRDECNSISDWEMLIHNPDQILLQITREFDTGCWERKLEKFTKALILKNTFTMDRKSMIRVLSTEFNDIFFTDEIVYKKLSGQKYISFENSFTIETLISISLTIPRLVVTHFTKPMQKLLRVEWDETDPSEIYQFLTQEGPDFLPTDLELLKLGISNFVRLHLQNYFTNEFESFFTQVRSQLFQCGLHSELMGNAFEEFTESESEEFSDIVREFNEETELRREKLSAIFQSFWDNYSKPSADTYSYLT